MASEKSQNLGEKSLDEDKKRKSEIVSVDEPSEKKTKLSTSSKLANFAFSKKGE